MSEKKYFYFALVWILLTKVFWILGPTSAMGIPRLGDDSLVYLWTGASSVVHSQLGSNAIQDIVSIRNLADNPTPELDFARARVTMRVASAIASPYAITTGILLDSGLPLKYVTAVMELLVFLVFLAGLIYFGLRRFGYGPNAIVLVFLSFALLPNQGIHFLVPSVLTMSCALVLYSIILDKGSAFFVFVLTPFMLLIHTIAQIYLLLALLILLIESIDKKKITRDSLQYVVGIALGFLVWLAMAKLSGVTYAKTSGMGGVELSQFFSNFLGFLQLLKEFLFNQPVLVILLVYGLVYSYKLSDQIQRFLLALVLGMVASFLINIPGYPSDLTTRLFVPFSILLFYSASLQLWQKLKIINLRFASPLVLFLLFVLTAEAKPFFGYFFDNINQRYQIIHEDLMRAELMDLPKQADVIWLDGDIQMMYGLLLGGGNLHFIPYTTVKKTDYLRELIKSPKDFFIAAPFPERLNGTSSLKGSFSLMPRFYGYRFDQYKKVSLYFDSSLNQKLFIRMEGNNQTIRVSTENGLNCKINPLNNYPTWFEVKSCSGESIHVESQSSETRFLGLQLANFNPNQSWPWGNSNIRLRAEPSHLTHDVSEVKFGWESFLGKDLVDDFSNQTDRMTVKTDQSGVIWIQFIKS